MFPNTVIIDISALHTQITSIMCLTSFTKSHRQIFNAIRPPPVSFRSKGTWHTACKYDKTAIVTTNGYLMVDKLDISHTIYK